MLGTKNTIIGISIAALIGAAIWAFSSWQNALDENKRLKANYESSLILIEGENSKELAEFTFKKNRELMDFIDLNSEEMKDLKNKLAENSIKLKRIDKIVATQVTARDTIINKIDLDSLASKITAAKPFKIPFVDSTKCFYFKMELVYLDGRSEIRVLDRRYDDTIYDITTWERNKWKLFGIIPTRLFGRKIYKVKLISECGQTKTIILNKKK